MKVIVPRENVNDETVSISFVGFTSGSFVKKGENVVTIETSKTNIDIEAPIDGYIFHKLELGGEVAIGEELFSLDDIEIVQDKDSNLKSISIDSSDNRLEKIKVKFSNDAVERAQKLNVDLSNFKSGWITVADVESFYGISAPTLKIHDASPLSLGPGVLLELPTIPHKISPLIKRKQAEIKNLLSGDHGHTSSTISARITLPGERIISPPFLFKNGISDLLIFEASRLLRQYPELNGFIVDNKSCATYDQVNFGWSFDSGKNLKVLAIKNTDLLTLYELQRAVENLLYLYESNETIPLDLLTESTVTFSDLSKSNASFMLPLINGRQSLMLGLTRKKNSLFEVFATFDHRVTEGLTIINFLTDLSNRVTSYFRGDGVVNIACNACNKSMKEELALGQRGFLKMTNGNGIDIHLCRNCFEGW